MKTPGEQHVLSTPLDRRGALERLALWSGAGAVAFGAAPAPGSTSPTTRRLHTKLTTELSHST